MFFSKSAQEIGIIVHCGADTHQNMSRWLFACVVLVLFIGMCVLYEKQVDAFNLRRAAYTKSHMSDHELDFFFRQALHAPPPPPPPSARPIGLRRQCSLPSQFR